MRFPRRRTTSRIQRGLTLVELLVVVMILVILVGVVLPLARPVLRGREVREAARQVNTFFAAAQARAMALDRPVAVVLERDSKNPDRCFQIALAKSPPPYAGDTTDARAVIDLTSTPWRATLSSAAAFASPDFVRPGDLIKFDFRGQLYQIVNIVNVNPSLGTAQIGFAGSSPPVVSAAGVPYQIFRTPRRSAAAPIELPIRTYIHLGFSGFGPPGLLPGPDDDYRGTDFAGSYSADSVGNPMITFAPTGALDRFYMGGVNSPVNQSVFLLLTRDVGNQNLTDPLRPLRSDAGNLWVTVNQRTGRVTTTENTGTAETDVTPAIFESRQSALAAQNMGGQ